MSTFNFATTATSFTPFSNDNPISKANTSTKRKRDFKTEESNQEYETSRSPEKSKIRKIDHISFNQKYIPYGFFLPAKAHEIVKKYDGLCDIICNLVLKNGLLGKGETDSFLRLMITGVTLQTSSVLSSHLLDIYSTFDIIKAKLFGMYPDNIFSFIDQRNLTVKNGNTIEVNKGLLEKGLKQLNCGDTLKLEVFKSTWFFFEGHSLLIKKVSDSEYIFFDPNTGEHRGLSLKALGIRIDSQLKQWKASYILFIRGKNYLVT